MKKETIEGLREAVKNGFTPHHTTIIALLDIAERSTSPVSQMTAEPVAWMRKWAFDGEKPAKQRNENGRMAWPAKFKVLPITQGYCFNDDVPLYAAPAIQQPQEAAKPSEGSGDVRDSALKRAASLLDSFYENAKVRGCEKMYEHFAKGAAECRAALSQERRCSMTTTPSTASQAPAVSIAQDHDFMKLLVAWLSDVNYYQDEENNIVCKSWSQFIAHIDAKRAQEREEAIGALAIAFEKMLCAAVGRDWSTSGISASSLVEELRSRAEKAEARATAAEAKLEAIRMAIDGLARFYTVGDEPVEYPDSDFLMYKDVSALFQPQPQADESGLPG